MSCSKYPHMFQPMTIKGVTFKNRVFASPITANRIVDHGYPTPEGIDAYETKARGGLRGGHGYRVLHRPRVRLAA